MTTYNTQPNVQSDTAKTPKGAVTVGASDAQIVPSNSGRVEVWISNTHATQTLDLALGAAAVANQGIRVAAGQTVVINSFNGEIRGIASGAGTTVQFAEV